MNGGIKPEHLTCLSGDRLVPKTHGRIVFRGLVDSLQAEVIEAQVLASQLGEDECCLKLAALLDYLRALMAAEVNETPLAPPFLFGMDSGEIRRRSHSAEYTFPSYTQGPLAARLNTLRAKLREAELCAVRVFGPGAGDEREDICLAMNRLSSALWLLFCESLKKH